MYGPNCVTYAILLHQENIILIPFFLLFFFDSFPFRFELDDEFDEDEDCSSVWLPIFYES